jgi:drug/metabolite transporter (DMT)-like permease
MHAAPEALWVGLAVSATAFQLGRNALSRDLVGHISPVLVSWSRFAFNLPFSTALIAILIAHAGLPVLSGSFLAWCAATALTQLLANVALVTSFRRASFSQSIALHKLDVVMGALIGVSLFGEHPSAAGWVGVLVSTFGVLLINRARPGTPGWRRTFHIDAGAALALGCAALLALTSFLLKQAALEFAAENASSRFAAAAHTLFHTTWIEVAVLGAALGFRRPSEFRRVRALWRPMLAVGATGFAGSLCWFWAYTLALVAYVRAVGQIEAVLSVAIAHWVFRERGVAGQIPGIAVVTLGIWLVLLG